MSTFFNVMLLSVFRIVGRIGNTVIVVLTGTALGFGIANAAPIEPEPNSTSYRQGSADRDSWETWFNGLQGSKKDGANYWTGQRSLKAPVPCRANVGSYDVEWLAGCLEASRRLASSDFMRKTDPQYWNGWNKKVAMATQQPPSWNQTVRPPIEESGGQTTITPAPILGSSETVLAQWTGVSMMTTRPFHAFGSWELQWRSSPGYFSIWLVQDTGVRKLVASQSEAGGSSSYVPDAGDYFLEVKADGPWTIKAVGLANSRRDTVRQDPPAINSPSFPPSSPASVSQPPTATISLPTKRSSETPYDQEAVIQIVGAAINQFQSGKNEMEKGAARPIRARALCNILPSRRANNWIGTVTKLSTNGEGRGVLYIQIGPHTFAQTWNNALSDISDRTLIDPQSSLFKAASQLHEGQKVRFNGTYAASDTDCFKESSMTLEGSITEPEFIIKFESVVAID